MFCDPDITIEDFYSCIDCTDMDEVVINAAIALVAEMLGDEMGLDPIIAFWAVYGYVTFARVDSYTNGKGEVFTAGAITKSAHRIEFASLEYQGIGDPEWALLRGTNHIIHELGHAFAGTSIGSNAYPSLRTAMNENDMLRRDNPQVGYSYGFASGYHHFTYQMACGDAHTENEIFADMFIGHVTGVWYNATFPPGWGKMPELINDVHVDMAEQKAIWIDDYMDATLGR